MRKKNKIPTIIGTIILLAGVFAGVFLLKTTKIFKIGASVTAAPKNVRVTNVSGNSATITWSTDDQTSSFVSYGEQENNLNKIQKESEIDQKFLVHEINLKDLKANTTYYYKINSDGTDYDNNAVPWTLTTGKELGINQNTITVSGSIISTSGQPSKRVLVYIDINGYLISTLTSDTGIYVFQLGSIRNSDLNSYAQIDITKTLLQISVQTGTGESASAQIFPQSANPVPPLMLGKVEDFRNLQPNIDGQSPNADLNLPENSQKESKFNVDDTIPTPSTTSVILESLDQGEVITSSVPEFFGKGPGGETITITVNSETPITGNVKIPNDGSWSWSPPTNLEEGAHTITITWIDATGITRSITRNFVVQAGEAPSFEATPSQQLSTPSPSPTITPTPTRTPIVTSSPTVSATPQAVPVTGGLTPTLLLFIMGLGVVAFSIFVWKYAND